VVTVAGAIDRERRCQPDITVRATSADGSTADKVSRSRSTTLTSFDVSTRPTQRGGHAVAENSAVARWWA
jgi:hypothetical protein